MSYDSLMRTENVRRAAAATAIAIGLIANYHVKMRTSEVCLLRSVAYTHFAWARFILSNAFLYAVLDGLRINCNARITSTVIVETAVIIIMNVTSDAAAKLRL
jgi:hypothetical protein